MLFWGDGLFDFWNVFIFSDRFSFLCYLSCLIIFLFETKIKIIKKQKSNLTLHVIQWQM